MTERRLQLRLLGDPGKDTPPQSFWLFSIQNRPVHHKRKKKKKTKKEKSTLRHIKCSRVPIKFIYSSYFLYREVEHLFCLHVDFLLFGFFFFFSPPRNHKGLEVRGVLFRMKMRMRVGEEDVELRTRTRGCQCS